MNGAFGEDGGVIINPNNLVIQYPIGQSLDQNQQIQIDSNYTGYGGVYPSTKVPLTTDTALDAVNGVDVQLQYAEQVLNSYLSE